MSIASKVSKKTFGPKVVNAKGTSKKSKVVVKKMTEPKPKN